MIERSIAEGVANWLESNRPGTVPSSHAIAAEMATTPKQSPLSIVRCLPGQHPHPKLEKFVLSLRTEYCPDDEEAAGDAAAAHAALAGVISTGYDSLSAALAGPSLWLRLLVSAGSGDEQLEDRTRVLTRDWSILVQTSR